MVFWNHVKIEKEGETNRENGKGWRMISHDNRISTLRKLYSVGAKQCQNIVNDQTRTHSLTFNSEA